MELNILAKDSKVAGKQKLPVQFTEEIRPDLVRRAVFTIQANQRQPYGAHARAGMRHAAELSRRRRKYRGSYGMGISRVPRKIMSRRGTRFNWVGAVAPGTVGGRRAHPPKASKIWSQKLNTKERRKAIRSAIAATLDKGLVANHGYQIPESYPFAVASDVESINKTKDVESLLSALGFSDEMKRASIKKVRAGRGKLRNRKYKKRTSVLLVVSEPCDLKKAAINIEGVEVTTVKRLNASLLAPGAIPGRATLFTQKALEVLEKEQLFV